MYSHVCTLDTVTGNLAVNSCFHIFQINERNDFFNFSKLFFVQIYRLLYHGDQNISWWRICRWRAVNFEIHLCSSDRKSDCIWRSISIQHVQIHQQECPIRLEKFSRMRNYSISKTATAELACSSINTCAAGPRPAISAANAVANCG